MAQRQRDKIKLGRQERNLRALLSHADVGIAQIDPSGQFKLVNTRYCDLVHRPATELLQLRIQDILQVNDASQIDELLGKVIKTAETLVLENNVGLLDGTRLWMRSNIAVIFDQSDPVRYLVATADDVTAQHTVEDELEA